MTTIANLIDHGQRAKLIDLAGQAHVPVDAATPTDLLDALCELCGCDLLIAPPIVGTIACRDCARDRAVGKAGRRYVKATRRPRTAATPQEMARAGRVDISQLSEAEVGRLVRNGWLGVETRRIHDAKADTSQTEPKAEPKRQPKRKPQPKLTPLQARQVDAVMEVTGMDRRQAIAFVTTK